MSWHPLFLIACALLVGCVSATIDADAPASPKPVAITDLVAKSFPDPQKVFVQGLPYRLFIPKDYDPARQYPLVLFLHGAGERGLDNTRQGANNALLWVQPKVQEKHPCFVVLPQCPQNVDTLPLPIATKAGDAPKVTRVALPLGTLLRGERKRLIFLADQAGKDTSVDLVFSNIRLSRNGKDNGRYLRFAANALQPLQENFVFDPAGCYCDEQLAPTSAEDPSSISADGLSVQVKGFPGKGVRLGLDLPCVIRKDTVLYVDVLANTTGNNPRIGFLREGNRLPEYRWVNTNWGQKTPHTLPAQPSVPMRLTLGLLDELQKTYSIDTNRIYVTGISMGGYGTWDIIARRPNLFAAAIPVCGGGDPATAPTIASIPIWAFHGGADTVVPTDRTRVMVEALKAAGATPRYTEYPKVGHGSWWNAYAEPELVEWLFSQARDAP